jgi:hypothetical protein
MRVEGRGTTTHFNVTQTRTEEAAMQALEIQEQARLLFAARGDKAIVEAAQKALQLKAEGREEDARDWRRIEAALVLMAGPRET